MRLLCPWGFQIRIMEWVAFAFPGDLPNPGIEPMSPALAGRFFTTGLPGKPSSYEKTKVLGEKLACYSANGSKRNWIHNLWSLFYCSLHYANWLYFSVIIYYYCLTCTSLFEHIYIYIYTHIHIYLYLCWCSFQKEVLTLSWSGDEQALTGKQEVMLILLYKLRMANKQKSRESIFLSFLLCLVSYYIVHTIKARIGQGYLCLDWWHATRALGLELALLPAGSAWGT